mgnify:CR=1 FL=1
MCDEIWAAIKKDKSRMQARKISFSEGLKAAIEKTAYKMNTQEKNKIYSLMKKKNQYRSNRI